MHVLFVACTMGSQFLLKNLNFFNLQITRISHLNTEFHPCFLIYLIFQINFVSLSSLTDCDSIVTWIHEKARKIWLYE